MAFRYSSNNLILPGDRVAFKSKGYKEKTFHALVLAVYKLGSFDMRKWKVLVDDGLGNPRTVDYERLKFFAV